MSDKYAIPEETTYFSLIDPPTYKTITLINDGKYTDSEFNKLVYQRKLIIEASEWEICGITRSNDEVMFLVMRNDAMIESC